MPKESTPAVEVHVETRAQLREWLAGHATPDSSSIWLVTWKKATGRPAPSYDDIVEEALCFGWIDSTSRTLDAERSALRLAPRRRRSGWARTNKVRIVRLEAQGLMTDAGRAVIDRAKADGSWTLLDDVEDLTVPDDLAAALAGHGDARANFDAFPRSVRRATLAWVAQAGRPETRRRRIEEAAGRAENNERAGPARTGPPRSAAPAPKATR
ncbi:MAG: hypothetical protein QOJ32_1193 [Frankiaceae bacterium]|jgi:uncharacterized protein YdeI (YjbR/CyaY-like superfamily)|nr:hypothetical protein [Frankiaceae bacterium]